MELTKNLKKDRLIYLAAATVGLLFVVLFFNKSLNINYTAFVLYALTLTFLAAPDQDTFNKKRFAFYAVICGLLSVKYTFSSNLSIRGLNFFVIPGVFFYALTLGVKKGEFSVSSFFRLIFRPFMRMHKFPYGVFSALKIKSSQKSTQITIGIVFAALMLSVVIPLMLSADEAFSQLFYGLFSIDSMPTIVFKLIYFLFASCYGFALIYILYNEANKPVYVKPEENKSALIQSNKEKFVLDPVTVKTFLYIVGFVYMAFVGVQYIYLFGKIRLGLSADFDYAQYARSGCFQLWYLSVINYVTVLVCIKLLKNKEHPADTRIKSAYSLFVVSNFLLSLSAIYKMTLYYNEYGLTALRLYVFTALDVQVISIVALTVRIWLREFNITRFVVSFSLCVYCLLSLCNTEAFIAKSNLKRYEKTGKIDFVYITETLSIDAFEPASKYFSDKYNLNVTDIRSGLSAYGLTPEEEAAVLSLNGKYNQAKREYKNAAWQEFNFGLDRLVNKY